MPDSDQASAPRPRPVEGANPPPGEATPARLAGPLVETQRQAAGKTMGRPRLFRVLACEIALREICYLAARSRNLLDLEFLPQGLHDRPAEGRAELQRRLDALPPRPYEAILVGYGLCGRLLDGVTARQTPLVVPRAHDCITLFLGSKERYEKAFFYRPGTYYFTSGWIECAQKRGLMPSSQSVTGLLLSQGTPLAELETWSQQYSQAKAQALREAVREWTAHYTHGVLIEFDFTRSLGLTPQVREICARQGWHFEKWEGDLGLLRRWLEGDWSAEEFLIVPPGHRIVPSYDGAIIRAEPVSEAAPSSNL